MIRAAAARVSRHRSSSLAWLVALALLGHCGIAAAAVNCRVTVPTFQFGNYIPGDTAPLDVTGEIGVRCAGTAGSFLATLSTGASGTFAERHMVSGPSQMRYNFYTNPARTLIWGDGTNGSVPVVRMKLRPGRETFLLPVYGRVFPRQSVGAGAYLDNVIVTVIF
jgi:spore coat protein U-like protein